MGAISLVQQREAAEMEHMTLPLRSNNIPSCPNKGAIPSMRIGVDLWIQTRMSEGKKLLIISVSVPLQDY